MTRTRRGLIVKGTRGGDRDPIHTLATFATPALASIHPDTHLRIARACWMVTSLQRDNFGQICTNGPKVGHSYMKTNIKLRLIDQNL